MEGTDSNFNYLSEGTKNNKIRNGIYRAKRHSFNEIVEIKSV